MGGKGSSSCSVGTGGAASSHATEGSADLAVTISPADGQAWPDAGKRAAALIQVLAMDAVQQAGSGHPGTATSLAPAARELLARDAIAAQVVSMPCLEWFAEQEPSYQEEVLPARVRARVGVEAGIALGWRAFAGDAGECVSLEHFGASADDKVPFEKLGFTAERMAAAARAGLARLHAGGRDGS